MLRRVFNYIQKRRLMRPGERIAVAVSGGADSIGLLRLLLAVRGELGVVLCVAHFNHKIRGEAADADEEFVRGLAAQWNLEFAVEAADTPAYAMQHKLSLEAAARELRYGYFAGLLETHDRIATAHTLDDQAETVLLRLLRGTGTAGLAGIAPLLPVGEFPRSRTSSQAPCTLNRNSEKFAIRPLLEIPRTEIESYLRGLGQDWREDATNQERHHTRNRLRHALIPALERDYNPRVKELLAGTAEIARAEEEYWTAEVQRLFPLFWLPGQPSRSGRSVSGRERPEGDGLGGGFDAARLLALPVALQRRLVLAAAEATGVTLGFQHVTAILDVAQGGPGAPKRAELPGGWSVRRTPRELRFEPTHADRQKPAPTSYEYALTIPGELHIPEVGTVVQVTLGLPIDPGRAANRAYNEGSFERLLGPDLVIRNWRPGDRYRPPHSKAPKKVKELLQRIEAAPDARALWPVVVHCAEVVWMRGTTSMQERSVCIGHVESPEGLRPVLVQELPANGADRE